MKHTVTGLAIALSWLALGIAMISLITRLFPDRAAIVMGWSRGLIHVSHGCTVFSPGILAENDREQHVKKSIHELRREGEIALFETPFGPIWYQSEGGSLPELVAEDELDIYRFRSGMVHRGDIVMDVGANVGTVSKAALDAGASLVIAVEPAPVTLECLRRNMASEIQAGRVIVVAKGAWNQEASLPLHLDANPLGSSFVFGRGAHTIQLPLTTIDRIVSDLNLSRLDLIKMDIEGAERQALSGAEKTLRRFHPRISLELEHFVDDVDVLPAIARGAWPGYKVNLTPCTKTADVIHPDVALLTPD
jgi:FkbM family methyltransferase